MLACDDHRASGYSGVGGGITADWLATHLPDPRTHKLYFDFGTGTGTGTGTE